MLRPWRNNRGQTGDKRESNRSQTGDKWETNGGQMGDNPLCGSQQKIMKYISNLCKCSGDNVSREVTLQELSDISGLTKGSVKKTIRRLRQAGILRLVDFKNGCQGWRRFIVEDHIREI